MQTDETISERLRLARHQVFWRLHVLPWLLLFLLLLVMYILQGRNYRRGIAAVKGMSYSNGVHAIRVEAIENGVGRWEINSFGQLVFLWVPPVPLISSNNTAVTTRDIGDVSDVGDSLLTLSPKAYANLKTFNLEKELIRTTSESIHTVFEGLRTYDKVLNN
ncbi:MAG: hypothetical protein WC375_00345 [Methanomassiliicoccales archaeon]|jgi:hypothetical protein